MGMGGSEGMPNTHPRESAASAGIPCSGGQGLPALPEPSLGCRRNVLLSNLALSARASCLPDGISALDRGAGSGA